jgi:hypothetical protein
MKQSVLNPDETYVKQYLPLMNHILISIYVHTLDEMHVNQYLLLMKHILISIYP